MVCAGVASATPVSTIAPAVQQRGPTGQGGRLSDIPKIDLWIVRSRIESLAGEARVNLIRLAAVLAFYARHLIAVTSADSAEAGRYHVGASCVAAAWFALVIVVHLCLSRRYL